MSLPPEMFPRAGDGKPLFGDRYWHQGEARAPVGIAASPDRIDEDDYKLLADNLPTLCWIANPDGYITWYNRRWHEYCGTTPAEMEGWGWQSVHDPAVLPSVIDRWTASIATGQPFEMVFPLRGADGTFRPFLTRILPVHDRDGQLRRWIGNNIDISQQVAVEQELRLSQQKLEEANRALAEREAFLSRVFASSTDCIKVLDLDGRLTFMTDGAARRVMEVERLRRHRGLPLAGPSGPAMVTARLARRSRPSMAHARRVPGQLRRPAPSTMQGTPRWWHVAVSPIPRRWTASHDRILSVSRDITALRQSEAERDRFVRLAENSSRFRRHGPSSTAECLLS